MNYVRCQTNTDVNNHENIDVISTDWYIICTYVYPLCDMLHVASASSLISLLTIFLICTLTIYVMKQNYLCHYWQVNSSLIADFQAIPVAVRVHNKKRYHEINSFGHQTTARIARTTWNHAEPCGTMQNHVLHKELFLTVLEGYHYLFPLVACSQGQLLERRNPVLSPPVACHQWRF